MVKTAKLQNIEIVEDVDDQSDNEIELKPHQNKKVMDAPINEQLIEHQTKARRKLNLSDEERERRRQSMIETRAKRTALVEHKRMLEMEYLKQQEEATHQKIMKKAEQLKKKKEKELYNKYLEELNSKPKQKPKKQPKVIYESETEEEEESEDEIIVVKKKKSQKGGSSSAPPSAQPVSIPQQPIPQPQRPMFRIAY